MRHTKHTKSSRHVQGPPAKNIGGRKDTAWNETERPAHRPIKPPCYGISRRFVTTIISRRPSWFVPTIDLESLQTSIKFNKAMESETRCGGANPPPYESDYRTGTRGISNREDVVAVRSSDV
ncbi:hypothetical protein PM082_021238 [Marasmius tenuissimus]|nr:hypothetical protein PM082_021238 [Marasmius tenuissimus]